MYRDGRGEWWLDDLLSVERVRGEGGACCEETVRWSLEVFSSGMSSIDSAEFEMPLTITLLWPMGVREGEEEGAKIFPSSRIMSSGGGEVRKHFSCKLGIMYSTTWN